MDVTEVITARETDTISAVHNLKASHNHLIWQDLCAVQVWYARCPSNQLSVLASMCPHPPDSFRAFH